MNGSNPVQWARRCAAVALSLTILACSLAAGSVIAGEREKDADKPSPFTLDWANNFLKIHGERLPGKHVDVHYLEAYCRPNSTNRPWGETVIGHRTKLVEAGADKRSLHLRSTLKDGVTVDHDIRTCADGVEFRLKAHNPTEIASVVHWAQPCIRVGRFTGRDQKTYLEKCFIFLDGKLTRMPTPRWATEGFYTPGQVWAPRHVSRRDVNPRPLSADVPSNGLIGCFSGDEKMILATASEPYQELFQGVVVCIHSDFRIGGLQPGETKTIRSKIYLVDADVPALLRSYARDFPEHAKAR
jgi:hypothetical protein